MIEVAISDEEISELERLAAFEAHSAAEPAARHVSLTKLAQGMPREILAPAYIKLHKVRYYSGVTRGSENPSGR